MSQKSVRVAAAQYSVGSNIDENLESSLRLIARAAEHKVNLLVLPEFINHLSWYDSVEHCYEVSLELDSDFLKQLAAAARNAGCYVVANCTLRRDRGSCSGTSLMYSPNGELLGSNDKQVLIGHENNFLQRANQQGPMIDTELGRLGMYACMDGVVFETPRYLALRGGQILCNSVNSFAPDESSLHIPVRAAENKVFVVAANKIGPLVPANMLDDLSTATNIPARFLSGAGESQIVDPLGKVLAIASLDREELVFADIDPNEANNKQRPDGSDLFAMRRPDLYAPIATDPAEQQLEESPLSQQKQASTKVAMLKASHLTSAIDGIVNAVENKARLIVLPELFCYQRTSEIDASDLNLANEVIECIQAHCADSYVATSLPQQNTNGQLEHTALLIGENGVVCAQAQLHIGKRHSWAKAGSVLNTVDLGFSHLGLLSGDDAIYPEAFRLLALKGVDTVLLPFDALESWETETGLFERAGENHINLIAVNRGDSSKTSFTARLHKDFTILTPWESREFDGKLTFPPLTFADDASDLTFAEINPAYAANKVVSSGTDVLHGRAWALAQPLLSH